MNVVKERYRAGGFRRGLAARMAELSWRDLVLITLPVVGLMVAVAWVAVAVLRPAPPDRIRLLSGPDGSTYRTNAERYQKIIEGYGVKVEVLPSKGSLDNLQKLADPKFEADVAFVQGGLTDGVDISRLASLGTVFVQPLMIYHRHTQPVEVLSVLKGKRLAVGQVGSGTRALALTLLKANDMDGKPTQLVDIGGEEAAKALAAGTVDAAFLMGDSATPQMMRKLRDLPGIDLINFRQAAGYERRYRFLSRLTLPEGAIDFGRDYPPRPYELIGPTVELVARKNLHPAVSDLLIKAAREIHGGPGLFRDAGEFPNAEARDFPISPDAERYYKSGGAFLYRHLPFWLATLVDRALVVVLPLLVLIIPATRVAPWVYRWRVRSRIYRWYGALMEIEREMRAGASPEQREVMLGRLDEIEASVNEIKTPLAFADQLYVLRGHVAMVRQRLGPPA
jgi:TRAP-type uncharacterized transport system substrate-binding protein